MSDAPSQSQAPADKKGPAKKPRASQNLVSGQLFMKSFFQVASAPSAASVARSDPSPVDAAMFPAGERCATRDDKASQMALKVKRDQSGSKQGATVPRKALVALSSSHSNAKADGKSTASQGQSHGSAPQAPCRPCASPCAKISKNREVIPSEGKQEGIGAVSSAAVCVTSRRSVETGNASQQCGEVLPKEVIRSSDVAGRDPERARLSQDTNEVGPTAGTTTAGKRMRDEGESTPAKSATRGASNELDTLTKMSPNPNSSQSYASPPHSDDKTSSQKEDISPSQDIYDLCANDDDEDISVQVRGPSTARSRKRSRATGAQHNAFVFAVPRPPSSTVSEEELAATRRPIMGSRATRARRGDAQAAAGAKSHTGVGIRSSLQRRRSCMSSEMRDLMRQLEKQVAQDEPSSARVAEVPCEQGACDSPSTFSSDQQPRSSSDLVSTPRGIHSVLSTPDTLPMSQGGSVVARTAHLAGGEASCAGSTEPSHTSTSSSLFTENVHSVPLVDVEDLLASLDSSTPASQTRCSSTHGLGCTVPRRKSSSSACTITPGRSAKTCDDTGAPSPAGNASSEPRASARALSCEVLPQAAAVGDESLDADLEDDSFLAELDRIEQVMRACVELV